MTSFTSTRFRSLITIPEIILEKTKQKCWVAKIWVADELVDYSYPFILPHFFNDKLTKDEFAIRFNFLQIWCWIDIRKEFFTKEFFNSYPAVLSN